MSIQLLTYDMAHPLLGLVARNRTVIHRLFGVRVPKGTTVHFDPTTLLMKHALQRVITKGDRTALEVGIGQGALLSLGLLQSVQIEIDGVDCSQACVRSSSKVAAYNGVDARFFESNLFGSVSAEREYDLIFFNPPYVPTEQGKQLQLTRRMRADGDHVWNGGDDGTTVLRAFLRQASRFLSPRGRVVFGVQSIFVPDEDIRDAIANCDLILLDRVTRWYIPSVVYVLGHTARHDA